MNNKHQPALHAALGPLRNACCWRGRAWGTCTVAGTHALKRLAKGRHPVSLRYVSELWRIRGGQRFGDPQIHLRPVVGHGGGPRVLDGGLSAFERLRLRIVAKEAAAKLEQ